jgi:hypothetical protein
MRHRVAGLLSQLEADRLAGLVLHDARPLEDRDVVAVCHIPRAQTHQIAAAQLAVDRLNNASSRVFPAIRSWVRTVQISASFSGGF